MKKSPLPHFHLYNLLLQVLVLFSNIIRFRHGGFVSSLSIIPSPLPIKILYDSFNSQHRDLTYHPEQPSRIDKCIELLTTCRENESIKPSTLYELIDISCNYDNYILSESYLQQARTILTKIHTEELVSSIETKCRASRQKRIDDGKPPLGFIGNLDHDTYLTTESYDVCLRATAIWMYCVDVVMRNNISQQPNITSMALTRPPGHHATKTLSNGFCIFNFAAAAAVYALSLPNCNKVSIIDWDVHYGQGVADIVHSFPNIRYVSMHQVPAFPYLGQSRAVVGEYKNVMTIPIAADSSWACGYKSAFTEHLLPYCYEKGEWEADLVIVCAGYDALGSDELASCNLCAEDYGKMTKLLKEHIGLYKDVDERNKVGLIFGLEGGYQLQDGVPGGNLADAVLETIKAAGA